MRASTRLVTYADRDPHVLVAALLGRAHDAAVAVEGREALGGLERVGRHPVRRASVRRLVRLPRQLEQLLEQRPRRRMELLRARRAGRRPAPPARAPRPPCAGCSRCARARTARSRPGSPATPCARGRGRGRASCRGCAGRGTSARRRRRCRRAARRASRSAPARLDIFTRWPPSLRLTSCMITISKRSGSPPSASQAARTRSM